MIKNLYDERAMNLPISELMPYEQNPRKISNREFQQLVDNIEQDPAFLISKPLLVNHTEEGTYIVYAGNQRLEACKTLGYDTVPCFVATALPEEVMKKRILLDNQHNGDWDTQKLLDSYDAEELMAVGAKFLEEIDFDKIMQEMEEAQADAEEKRPAFGGGFEAGESVVIKTEIIFADVEQRRAFDDFLVFLRKELPDLDTTSERLVSFLAAVMAAPQLASKILHDPAYRQQLESEVSDR